MIAFSPSQLALQHSLDVVFDRDLQDGFTKEQAMDNVLQTVFWIAMGKDIITSEAFEAAVALNKREPGQENDTSVPDPSKAV